MPYASAKGLWGLTDPSSSLWCSPPAAAVERPVAAAVRVRARSSVAQAWPAEAAQA
jgi:hypothetical protein